MGLHQAEEWTGSGPSPGFPVQSGAGRGPAPRSAVRRTRLEIMSERGISPYRVGPGADRHLTRRREEREGGA